MSLFESFRVAVRALAANKLRGSLTMLGVIIGVAAVIALMSLGKGAQASITAQVQSLGTNLLFVSPGQARQQTNVAGGFGGAQTLTYEDAQAIGEQLPELVSGVAPERDVPAQFIAHGENWRSRVAGVTPDYELVRNFHVASGEFINDTQVAARSSVIVLGATVAQNLFGDSDPIGEMVRISAFGESGTNARVIGVMETKGGGGFQNLDDQAFMPITTVMTRLSPSRSMQAGNLVGTITVQVASEGQIDQAIQSIGELLRQRHRVATDDFVISSQRDFLATINQVTGLFTAFLGAVAGISLAVGGIGIMNIMLVSVTERTHEIGIRKAVGARRRDILAQFIIEAVVVSVAGGAVGVLLGIGISRAVGKVSIGTQAIPSVIAPESVVLAVGVSAAVGLFFGIYPALRAARLNPIDALRYE
ncbi:MAG TPA: ABC transporter permease [Chloroflexota bacterium]|nr:ABC transporter permease [Chloroflexota bacterium]